jgi:virginiamycin B lyase
MTIYSTPTPMSNPSGVTTGPDGNLWFTENAGNKVARATSNGSITEFSVPTEGSHPADIATGPDGNLWVTESTAERSRA